MYRKYMTEDQNRKMKQLMMQNAHTGIRIEQIYPEVKEIVISHVRNHSSAFGSNHKEGIWTLSPQSEAYFFIECLNPECSTIGFDLGDIIRRAISNRCSEVKGEMECEGQEAPDHPEQSCDGHLNYVVRIYFK